jgi:hypothetical protein
LLMVRRPDALTVLHVFGVEDVAASLQSCCKYQCIVDVIAISGSDLERSIVSFDR